MSIQDLELIQGTNESKSDEYRRYFRAKQTPRNTSVVAPPEFRQSYFTATPWCRTACQALSERIEVDSLFAQTEEATKFLNKFLKDLGGADFVNTAHMTAMEYGRAYLVPTGTDTEYGIGVQIVPGRDMVHLIDPYTGEVTEALRVYGRTRTKRAYYTAKQTVLFEGVDGGFKRTKVIPNPTGKIPVFPLICRDEVNHPWGRPEAKDIFTIQDSGCRIATDLAIASATMAVPLRGLSGVDEEDFTVRNPDGSVATDSDGNPRKASAEELYMSRILMLSDSDAKFTEFTAAQLQNFTTALNFLVKQAAAIMGVPQSVFGVASDANPASGEAIRQDDHRLIRRAEQLTRGFENPWMGLFEYVLLVQDYGEQPVRIRWVDPSLPNLASRADAITKLAQVTVGGVPLYSWEELRQKLGDSQTEIDEAKDDIERQQLTRLLTEPDQPKQQTNPPVAA